MVEPVDLGVIREAAGRVGVEVAEVPPFRGIAVVTTALLLVGSRVAVAQVQEEVERRRGGQVFDLRADAARPIHRTKALRYGEVKIVAVDGEVRCRGGELIAVLTRLASGRGEKTVALVLDAIGGHSELLSVTTVNLTSASATKANFRSRSKSLR